ncbi:MAG: putative lipid II flippase FtsW [Desulfobacterales bacterium]|nr:putative lipid II flippase FtsW [Desulfobacterales bacterium]
MESKVSAIRYDIRLLFPVLFLVGIGIVMVYSASSALALKKFGNDAFFLSRQALYAAFGIVALVVCRHVPYRAYRPLVYPLLAASVAALAAVPFTNMGVSAGGAARWLRLGGLNFQPVELARFSLILFLAYSLSKKQDRVREFSIGFVPHVLLLAIFTGFLLVQPDFGSAVLLFALTWIILFVAGVRFTHLVSALLLLLPAAVYIMMSAQYRIKRWLSFLDPWAFPANEGYQVVHSLMGFGTGGIWGAGIGRGYQKLFYLPEPHTDFIFSVIGEELGLIGVFFILFLYFLVLWRGIRIALDAPDSFGSLVAVGLTAALGLQVCVNMGVTLGLLPTKGLTLPFLSYGGSSLLFNMASIGVLMNIGAGK